MVDVNMVVLENGNTYAEIDEVMYNNIRYVLLSNAKNAKDSCIRKIVVVDKEEYISKLEDESEFEIVLNLFIKKNKALLG